MTETYSVSADFSSGVSEHQLHAEINVNTTITTTILYVNRVGDVLNIVFNAAISGGERAELDIVVAAHTPVDLDDSKISTSPMHTALADADTTLTMTQINSQIITMSPTVNRTITMPMASSMAANLASGVSNSIKFRIINLDDANDASIIIAPAMSCVGTGHLEVAPPHNQAGTYHYSGTGVFKIRLTDAGMGSQSYTIYRVS